jgi:hypothetical protein
MRIPLSSNGELEGTRRPLFLTARSLFEADNPIRRNQAIPFPLKWDRARPKPPPAFRMVQSGGVTMSTIPIIYGEFYDVPRMIRFQLGGKWYFMRSRFDEEKDDYTDFYEVYLLPFHSEDEFKSNPNYWAELNNAFHLGQIPITEVGSDAT